MFVGTVGDGTVGDGTVGDDGTVGTVGTVGTDGTDGTDGTVGTMELPCPPILSLWIYRIYSFLSHSI